jgi:hypothetical protein
MLVLGITAIALIIYLYWLFQIGTVLEIKNNPVPVRPKTIDHDQYIILHYDYCKYSNTEGTVESSLVSKTTVLPLPTLEDTTKKACHSFDAPYPLPGQAPSETYHYKFKACYPLNPVKTVCTEWESKEFVIKSPEIKRNIEIPKQ